MIGVDAKTGKVVRDEVYLKSRIESCLSMRQGTHPMRRQKGSRIPELLDHPLNSDTLFDIQVAVMDALDSPHNGFSDIQVRQVKAVRQAEGSVGLSLILEMNDQVKTLQGIVVTK